LAEKFPDLWNDLSGQVLRGISARSVDALGVDGETACGVGEYGDRAVTLVRGRAHIEGGRGIADANPVGRSAEFPPDNRDRSEAEFR
jgi:hypothetical protein